jgi:hypothetical protein
VSANVVEIHSRSPARPSVMVEPAGVNR